MGTIIHNVVGGFENDPLWIFENKWLRNILGLDFVLGAKEILSIKQIGVAT